MTSLKLLVLEGSDPLFLGHQHGEIFRTQIKELAEIRMERMCNVSLYKKPKDVLELAAKHINILQDFDVDLFLELRGISEASNVSLEKLIVLNHYTDLRDINPHHANLVSAQESSSGCSLIYSPHKILGQTWDIHGSALPYVCLLSINKTVVFSIMGCLGMTGMNKHGVAICINNLNSTDAKIGIIWPALVRKALRKKDAILAKDEVMNAPLGSGHHYAIADKNNFFSIETSGTKKSMVTDNADKLYFHTNHCLCKEIEKNSYIRKESNTLWRYEYLSQNITLDKANTAQDIFLALAQVSMPYNEKTPHNTTTCGTIVMDILGAKILACQGIATKELLKCPQVTLTLNH